jgi:HK97 family phage portal protein
MLPRGVLVDDEAASMSSILFRGPAFPSASELIPRRRATTSRSYSVSSDDAMKNSVVWACLRLRADLISTSPIDCYRNIDGRAVEFTTPQVLRAPGGASCGIVEWLYSTQVDLDRFGNCYGIITARDGLGLPARIELVPAETVTVLTSAGMVTGYRIGSMVYQPGDIWHEKQFTMAGVPVGLSPLAAAALTLSTSLSAQEFAADWFSGAGVPASHLRNTAKTLNPDEAETVKDRFNSSVRTGDVFVTGADWEYEMLGAKASESSFIEAQHATGADMCRFLGVPGDMVDVNEQTGSVTYANITQRNLQLLIMNLGPAVTRREVALSALLPQPRYVKLNTDAVVLRMDPTTRAELNAILIDSKQRTPSEAREKDDLPPFTAAQIAEIQALTMKQAPAPQVAAAAPVVPPERSLTVSPVIHVDARQEPPQVHVDARQDAPNVTVEPAVVNVSNEFTMPDIDVDARTEPPVVNVTNQIEPPPVPAERAVRKTIEHTADGRIAAIIEETV